MEPIHRIAKRALTLALKLVNIWFFMKNSIVGQIAQAFGNALWIPKGLKPLVMKNIFKTPSFFCHFAM